MALHAEKNLAVSPNAHSIYSVCVVKSSKVRVKYDKMWYVSLCDWSGNSYRYCYSMAKLAVCECFRAGKQKMVKSCCAVGCTNRYTKGGGLQFHRFPTDSVRRARWIAAVDWRTGNRTSTHGFVVLTLLVVWRATTQPHQRMFPLSLATWRALSSEKYTYKGTTEPRCAKKGWREVSLEEETARWGVNDTQWQTQ